MLFHCVLRLIALSSKLTVSQVVCLFGLFGRHAVAGPWRCPALGRPASFLGALLVDAWRVDCGECGCDVFCVEVCEQK